MIPVPSLEIFDLDLGSASSHKQTRLWSRRLETGRDDVGLGTGILVLPYAKPLVEARPLSVLRLVWRA
jgi:hypothetical protein